MIDLGVFFFQAYVSDDICIIEVNNIILWTVLFTSREILSKLFFIYIWLIILKVKKQNSSFSNFTFHLNERYIFYILFFSFILCLTGNTENHWCRRLTSPNTEFRYDEIIAQMWLTDKKDTNHKSMDIKAFIINFPKIIAIFSNFCLHFLSMFLYIQ